MSTQLSVIDFSRLGLGRSDEEISESDYSEAGDKLIDIFSSTGFVYLSDHGVSKEQILHAEKVTEKFFDLPTSLKQKYRRTNKTNTGWGEIDTESPNLGGIGDYKESFNITPVKAVPKSWPDEEIPEFRKVTDCLFDTLRRLSVRVLRAMAVGLKLDNPDYFNDYHTSKALSTLRYIYYPPVTTELKPGQTRCSDHSDYGSITLLFQDNIGGLQILSKDGEWLDVEPLDGGLLVNVGDFMERWTSDKLVSTKHRVVIPEAEFKKQQIRRSLAFFAFPDEDVTIKCIDGKDKYEPVNSLAYRNMKYVVAYHNSKNT